MSTFNTVSIIKVHPETATEAREALAAGKEVDLYRNTSDDNFVSICKTASDCGELTDYTIMCPEFDLPIYFFDFEETDLENLVVMAREANELK